MYRECDDKLVKTVPVSKVLEFTFGRNLTRNLLILGSFMKRESAGLASRSYMVLCERFRIIIIYDVKPSQDHWPPKICYPSPAGCFSWSTSWNVMLCYYVIIYVIIQDLTFSNLFDHCTVLRSPGTLAKNQSDARSCSSTVIKSTVPFAVAENFRSLQKVGNCLQKIRPQKDNVLLVKFIFTVAKIKMNLTATFSALIRVVLMFPNSIIRNYLVKCLSFKYLILAWRRVIILRVGL